VDLQPFTKIHEGQIGAIQRHFGEYIKEVHRRRQLNPTPTPAPTPAPTLNPAPPAPIVINITPDGFPVVPDVSFHSLKKEELEELMRNYLNMHYSTFTLLTSTECQFLTLAQSSHVDTSMFHLKRSL
jgi:hypothetical protein